ncbi:MAG TPA: peptide ABC transporter substrate-binding protein [Roseiflexaceae bacterium]|jgi:peptide/nickel transport system substrate-binding protein|nr:peptide ABC transporter substrate-binding protein [Roseiflexaceae bacterium]
MARRIRWQILIASVSGLLVLGLMSFLALTNTAVSRPLNGGTYVEGFTTLPRQINPLVSDPARDPTAADIRALVFEGLMRIGVDGLPEPELAAEAPQISADGTVYTFTLRPDVQWQDGTPLTADDVVWTLRAVQSSAYAGDPVARGVWGEVLIDKLDDHTVRCTLTAPFAPFLSQATFPILPAHLLQDVPPDQWATAPFNQHPIGTGPYKLTELTTEHALFAANATYHDGRPFLDNVEFRFFSTTQDAQMALMRGQIMGLGFLGTSELNRVPLPRDVTKHVTPLDAYTVLTFNMRGGPLADVGVRRALVRGFNKDTLINDTLHGEVARLDTPILPGWWAAAPDLAVQPPSQQAAADALTSLGYELGPDGVRTKDGQPLNLPLITDDTPDRVAAAREIARQWGALGVQVPVETLQPDVLQQRLQAHDFTMAIHGWQRLGPDPDVLELWDSRFAASGRNYAGVQDEELDRLLRQARQEQNIAARRQLYITFQQRWLDLAPSITLYQPVFVYATRELGGLELSQSGEATQLMSNQLLLGREDRFRNVSRWFLRSAREIRGDLRSAP